MISVCIATYNGEKFLKEQLDSILVQLEENDEVIISDDSSSDDTLRLIRSLKDKRIRVLANQHFRSPIYNFENALRSAGGDHIFLSDQDDIWLPQKVKTMLYYLNRGNDLIVSNCKIVTENLEPFNDSYFQLNKSGPGIVKNLLKNSYMGCCMAFNKRLLQACLPFPSYLPMHDSYIGLMAELKFKVQFIKDPLILHRKHASNNSDTASGKSRYTLKQKILFRIKLIYALASKVL